MFHVPGVYVMELEIGNVINMASFLFLLIHILLVFSSTFLPIIMKSMK